MGSIFLEKLFSGYRRLINGTPDPDIVNYKLNDLTNWKNTLFLVFLQYCLPVSLVAAVPGIYMALKDHYTGIAFADVFCLALLAVATFGKKIALPWRKLIIVSLFYLLAIVLILKLGYIGPGIFYLLTITILISLIFPIRYAYGSVLANAMILLVFAEMIRVRPAGWALANQYHPGEWIAFSANLVFISLVVVLLIHKIFNGLQLTIHKKDMLREHYERIFDNSPVAMWVFDTETLQFLTVNMAACKHYGYSKEEFLNMTIQSLRPPHYQQEIAQLVRLNKDENQFRLDDVLHIKKNGELINVTIESSLLTYKGRHAKLVLATDVTAQLKAEMETYQANLKIKESEASLQAIFKSTLDGYILLDEENRLIAFNEKAKKSIRFNKNSLPFTMGSSIFDYVEESRHVYFLGILNKVREGKTVEYDRAFNIDGHKLWVHYTLTPVDNEGLPAGVCITGRDITSYKVYTKTIEAQNRQLREISWTQAHLVRAPLVNIMGLNKLLQHAKDAGEQENLLRLLDESAQKLDTVIAGILDKAKESSATANDEL